MIDLVVKMDEEMIALRNVMPVELAIRREMEYRAKVEVLKNRRLINLHPLLPSQVRSIYDFLLTWINLEPFELSAHLSYVAWC